MTDKTDKIEPKIIEHTNKLSDKIGNVRDLKKFFTPERIAAAQQSIEDVQVKFIENNIESIQKLIDIGRKAPSSQQAKDTFISMSFSHKGQAESLGYKIFALTLGSLASYSQDHLPGDPNAEVIVGKHIEIIEIIVKENITDGANTVGDSLLKSLPELIAHFHPSAKV